MKISRGNRNIILDRILNCFTELWSRSGFIRTPPATRQYVENRGLKCVELSLFHKYNMSYGVGNKEKDQVEKSREQISSLSCSIFLKKHRDNDRCQKKLIGHSASHLMSLHLPSCLTITSAASVDLHNTAYLVRTDEFSWWRAKVTECVSSEQSAQIFCSL